MLAHNQQQSIYQEMFLISEVGIVAIDKNNNIMLFNL